MRLLSHTPSYQVSSPKQHPILSRLVSETTCHHIPSHTITYPPRNQTPSHHDRTHSSHTPDTTEHSTASLLNLTQPSTSVSVNHTRHNTPTSRTLHDTIHPPRALYTTHQIHLHEQDTQPFTFFLWELYEEHSSSSIPMNSTRQNTPTKSSRKPHPTPTYPITSQLTYHITLVGDRWSEISLGTCERAD
jgi:hypothetical protein